MANTKKGNLNRKLTPKQKKFVENYIKTGNGVKSALLAYDIKSKKNKYGNAAAISSRELDKPIIKKYLKSIANSIPDSLLVKRHIELLNKRDSITRYEKEGTGKNTRLVQKIIDLGPHVEAVKTGLHLGYKLKGSYAPEKHLFRGKIDFGNLENLSNEELKRIADEGEEGVG